MGPLSNIWEEIHEMKNKKKGGTMNIKDLEETMDKIVIMLGQTNNTINFERRLLVLQSIQKDKIKSKSMIKENQELFEKPSTHLFGSKFEKFLHTKAKSRKRSKELFVDTKERRKSDYRMKKPFRGGPSSRSGYDGGHWHANRQSQSQQHKTQQR